MTETRPNRTVQATWLGGPDDGSTVNILLHQLADTFRTYEPEPFDYKKLMETPPPEPRAKVKVRDCPIVQQPDGGYVIDWYAGVVS